MITNCAESGPHLGCEPISSRLQITCAPCPTSKGPWRLNPEIYTQFIPVSTLHAINIPQTRTRNTTAFSAVTHGKRHANKKAGHVHRRATSVEVTLSDYHTPPDDFRDYKKKDSSRPPNRHSRLHEEPCNPTEPLPTRAQPQCPMCAPCRWDAHAAVRVRVPSGACSVTMHKQWARVFRDRQAGYARDQESMLLRVPRP